MTWHSRGVKEKPAPSSGPAQLGRSEGSWAPAVVENSPLAESGLLCLPGRVLVPGVLLGCVGSLLPVWAPQALGGWDVGHGAGAGQDLDLSSLEKDDAAEEGWRGRSLLGQCLTGCPPSVGRGFLG